MGTRERSEWIKRGNTLDEGEDLLVLVKRGGLLDEIDLVLEDDDVLELHDLDGSQVLRGLRLRAGLIAGDEEESGVHDGGTVQHGGHEDVVAGAVDEGDVPHKAHHALAVGVVALEHVLLVAAVRAVAAGLLSEPLVGFVDLGVGIAQLDGDVSHQLVLETHSLRPIKWTLEAD